MRSSIGCFSFGILVLFVASVRAGISRNSQIIHDHDGHGYSGQKIQRFVPTISYRSGAPEILARRAEARYDIDDEFENLYHTYSNEDEDEEVPDSQPNWHNNRKPITSHPQHVINDNIKRKTNNEESLDDEELHENEMEEHPDHLDGGISSREEEDHQDEEYRMFRSNNNYPRKTHSKIRTSSRNYLNKNVPINTRRSISKKANSSKKKKPITETSNEDYYPSTNNYQKVSISKKRNEIYKQNLNLEAIANSHEGQFVATPIADLILKLSISLARPIGHGNETASYFNIPIRLSNTGIVENNSQLNKTTNQVMESELKESIIPSTVSVPLVPNPISEEVSKKHEIDDKEDNEDQDQETILTTTDGL